MEIIEKNIEAKVDNLHVVLEFLEEQLENHQASMKVINVMSISLEEMFANICLYAYEDKPEPHDCKIEIWFEGDMVNVRLTDSGMEFNPLAKQDPDVHAEIEDRGIGGLGIFMVKKYMDECTYDRVNGQNIFTMKKVIK